MIATGTDVKPIEVLIFLRDVKSELYFEQMKGRGVRSIEPDRSARRHPRCRSQDALHPDRRGRRHRKPEKHLPAARSRPRHRLRQTARQVSRRVGATTTPSPRSRPALPRSTGASARRIAPRSSKRPAAIDLPGLAANCSTPSIPTPWKARAAGRRGARAETGARLRRRRKRRKPFDDPALRRLSRRRRPRRTSRSTRFPPTTLFRRAGTSARRTDAVDKFRRFLEERHDELVALQILYGRPTPIAA